MIYNHQSPGGLMRPELEISGKRGIIRTLNIKTEKISKCVWVNQKK